MRRASFLVIVLNNALAAGAEMPALAREVSRAEIMHSLGALDYDRTSGREGERRGASLLEEKLRLYGVRHTRHEMRAYLSWPGAASLEAVSPDAFAVRAITHAFAAATSSTGVTAEAVFLPRTAEDDQSSIQGDVRGRIVIAQGLISPESAWRAQQAGAAGLVHVNDTDILHEMITTTIWGTPSTASAAHIPVIPVVSVGKADGERLRAAAAKGPLRLRLTAVVEQGWTTIPLVVAEIPGRTPDFALVATHLDAWYAGMTDTAGTVASILEMARVLQKHHAELLRGVRFAWWPGHSFGRYAGSTWYADQFWVELDEHCIAYTNLDGSGRRGSQMEAVYAGAWPGVAEWSRSYAKTLTGKEAQGGSPALFRPNRDSDSAFQGLGIPEFEIGVPGPPAGHPDVEPSGLISYWHTANDTLDKIDPSALELDTQYRVAQLHDLLTRAEAPLRLAPVVDAYARAVAELVSAAGPAFDLGPVREAVAALAGPASRLDQATTAASAEARARRDQTRIRLSHRLNAALYTKAGRFDQDPAVSLPILPLLAGARDLASLPEGSDARGFLETGLVRGRNAVLATLREARREVLELLAADARP
jgi:Zn-dependent M28 family amino/carboxypeptidase